DRPLVAVHGVHHHSEGTVEKLLRLLRIAVADQLGRADDVGEQHGDLLALALEGIVIRQDLLDQVPRGVAPRRSRRRPERRCDRADLGRQRLTTGIAEPAAGWVALAARGARGRLSRSASIAEPGSESLLGATS